MASVSHRRTQEKGDGVSVGDYHAHGGVAQLHMSIEPIVLLTGGAGTGKTRGILEHIHTKCVTYPGCRVLIVRATRTSLTESVLPCLEEEVLGYDHYAFTVSNANRENRHSYVYPNGSEIVLGGLDKPERLYSTQWDIVYICEATECTEDAFDKFARAMRARHIPMNKWGEPMLPGDPPSDRKIDPISGQPAWWRQRVMDCNPSGPSHWLYQRRRKKGDIHWIESRHEDNPTVDLGFLRSLSQLTGANRARLYESKWVASDGVVYPEFNASIHVVPRPKDGVIRETFASVDWGFTAPGSILVWGVDNDHRMFCLREIYFSRQTIDWWIARAKDVVREFGVTQFVCDPAEPAYILDFNKAGLYATEATNDISPGINAVRRRLRVEDNGRAGIYFCDDMQRPVPVVQDGRTVWLRHDAVLAAKKHPTGLLDEFDMYVEAPPKDGRNAKEEPTKEHDHACFVAGTMVACESGEKPIESVVAGDRVWTRAGLRPVVDAAMTDASAEIWRVEMSDGRTLEGTANHPIWVAGRGWTRLDALRYGDILVSYQKQKPSYSTASSIGAFQNQKSGPTGCTTSRLGAGRIGYTEGFGNPSMGRFLPDTSCITATAIHSTTTSVILSASAKNLTSDITQTTSLPSVSSKCVKLLTRFGTLQCRGIRLQKAESSTGKSGRWLKPQSLSSISNASGVVSHSNQQIPSLDSVTSTARPLLGERRALIVNRDRVPSAGRSFAPVDSQNKNAAPVIVRTSASAGRREAVYNLTVSDEHEYFANGVLASNCDAMRYAVVYLDGLATFDPRGIMTSTEQATVIDASPDV